MRAPDDVRPPPDPAAIADATRSAAAPGVPYVSAKALEHCLRAQLALADGAMERAGEEFSTCGIYDTQSAWPRYALAREHHRQGDDEAARKELRVALLVEPEHVPSLVLMATLALDAGDLPRAVLGFERAVKLAPSHSAAVSLLLEAYVRMGDFDRARSLAFRVLERGIEPTDRGWDAFFACAELLERDGALDEAEALLQRGLAAKANFVRARQALVELLSRRGRKADAAKLAAAGLAFSGASPVRVLEVAELFLDGELPVEAARYVSVLSRTDADERGAAQGALLVLGARLHRAGATERALEAFDAACALTPASTDLPDHGDEDPNPTALKIERALDVFAQGRPSFCRTSTRQAPDAPPSAPLGASFSFAVP